MRQTDGQAWRAPTTARFQVEQLFIRSQDFSTHQPRSTQTTACTTNNNNENSPGCPETGLKDGQAVLCGGRGNELVLFRDVDATWTINRCSS
jgi:hypothetical protein